MKSGEVDPYDLSRDFRLSQCVYCDDYENCFNRSTDHISPLFCPNFFPDSDTEIADHDVPWELY